MDKLTKEQRTKNMKAVKSKGSKIENLLMKSLWQKGYRYRKNDKSVFGKPDIVFKSMKIAVFCDSEFWHGKDWEIKKNQNFVLEQKEKTKRHQNNKINMINKWTKEQTIIALNLYCKIPFSKVSSYHPEILKFSKLIGRSPNSLKMKIGNFGSFDPELKKRGIVGLSNTSKLDEEVWNEYNNNWEDLAFESETLITKFEGKNFKQKLEEFNFNDKTGEDKIRDVKTRVNQNFFRQTVLSSYNNTCAITGINIPEMLVASHIIPWKDNIETRVNPKNGISLNVFHDKAFDKGFITITPDFKIKVSSVVYNKFNLASQKWFKEFDNSKLILPERFIPEIEFLIYHNENIFEKWK